MTDSALPPNESVQGQAIDVTPPLAEFRAKYEKDDNEWWRTECGHHQNLFEAACEELDSANARLASSEEKSTALSIFLRQACALLGEVNTKDNSQEWRDNFIRFASEFADYRLSNPQQFEESSNGK